jgi:hypothetical protein
MDAASFLDARIPVGKPRYSDWFWAILNTALGVICIWGVAHLIPADAPLLRGWAGMLGLVLLLHFGSFQLLALFWQMRGVAATPIMRSPLVSLSLAEFWGRRWNLGFRQLAHDLIFRPLRSRLGVAGAGFLVFVVSGMIHDLVISVPARGGYGLPTLYFTLQGAGVLVERTELGDKIGLGRGMRGWFFMALITAGPVFWLFHSRFVQIVVIPFLKAIRAL